MKKISELITNSKYIILFISCILIIFSLIGIKLTKINYDILVYLPEEIETIKGQNILTDEFEMGAYSVLLTENLQGKDILSLEEKIKNIEGVSNVISIYDLVGTNIPIDILPVELHEKIHKENTDLLFVTFKESTSSNKTLEAIEEMRKINPRDLHISGMSAMVLDTMDVSESEIAIYIVVAVILCLIILELFLDSYLVPILLLLNIGFSILLNLGTNIFLGEISYITKALVAVLQLGVTTDFSIFLYHAYERKKKEGYKNTLAMQKAITETFTSVTGSSLTTIFGFLVLCTMNLTLGRDLGIVMAKGVFLGVLSVLTLFPSLLLIFDKLIVKWQHKTFHISFKKLNEFVLKRYKIIFIIFLILLIPAYLANKKVSVYYKIDSSLPKNLPSISSSKEVKEKFNIVSPEIILINKDLKTEEVEQMIKKIKEVPGIDLVISFKELESRGFSKNLLSEDIIKIFESGEYQMIFINSLYEIASDELNLQIKDVNKILKEYDEKSILAGEGPLMRDLVVTSDEDFKNVNTASIICIAIIMVFVLKSLSLPILLICAIEFAIFINFSFSYFGGVILPFVAPIILGTIQLGATIDYAILLTTTYLKERKTKDKKQAIFDTLNYVDEAILVSGMCFFAATFGVGLISKLEMISAICSLISRGAIISMIIAIVLVPSILLIFDSLILKTTYKKERKVINMKKIITLILGISIVFVPKSAYAYQKEETVYAKLDPSGNVYSTKVNIHLKNDKNVDLLKDYTDLENIINTNSNHTYQKNEKLLTWESNGNSIFYEGTTNKELPIKTEITYTLDGKNISLEELLGKKGHVKINIRYNNKLVTRKDINGKKTNLYTPFLVTTGMVFDNELNHNIEVNNGKVIENGKQYMILGLSSPGLYESLDIDEVKDFDTITIKLDTNKFELPDIYSVITPKLIEEKDLEIFDQMDELIESMDKLEENILALESGAKDLKKGINLLTKGSKEIEKSITLVLNNLKILNDGTEKLEKGLNDTLNALKMAKKQIEENEELDNIKKLIIENKKSSDIDLLKTTAYLEKLYEEVTDTTLIDNLIDTLSKLVVASSKINEGTTSLRNGVETLNSKTKEFTNGVNKIEKGTDKLYDGIKEYNKEGIQELVKKTSDANDFTTKLDTLLDLSKNYKTFSYNKNKNASTKFIYIISGVKVKEEEKIEEQEVVKKTFMDRVKDLFK